MPNDKKIPVTMRLNAALLEEIDRWKPEKMSRTEFFETAAAELMACTQKVVAPKPGPVIHVNVNDGGPPPHLNQGQLARSVVVPHFKAKHMK